MLSVLVKYNKKKLKKNYKIILSTDRASFNDAHIFRYTLVRYNFALQLFLIRIKCQFISAFYQLLN